MQPGDLLSTFVEFSVAVAGFTGVVAALGPTRPTSWSPLQRGFFAALLGSTAISAGVSILGLVLLSSPLSDAAAWSIVSAAHLLGLLAVLAVRFGEMRSAQVPPNPVSIAVLVAVVGLIAAQLANVAVFRAGWLSVAALGTYAFLSLLYFVVLVRELWGDSSAT